MWNKQLTTDVLGNLIWDVAKLLMAGLVAAILWLLSNLSSQIIILGVSTLVPYKWLLTALLFCGSALVSILLYRRMSKFHPHFPRIDCDFEILELEIIYDHKQQNRMVYTKRKRLRALRNGLDRYFDRYRWTGGGTVAMRSSMKGQQIVTEERRSVWQFYAIKFNRKLGRGEEIQTEVVWELEDIENVAVPFLSSTVEEPTARMILKVKFPPELNVEEVIREISPVMGARKPFSTTPDKTAHSEYTWTIASPKLLYHYEVGWEWPS